MAENTHNGFEYVDLGLPSGLKWATCNVGAKKLEESGLYFQWGDTVGYEGNKAKAHSYWETTPFNNGNEDFDNKSILINKNRALNDNGVLRKAFDAAHAHMGGDWRMPTKDDFNELRHHTTCEFIIKYKSNDINGTLLTSKINGKTMFIPASGVFVYGKLCDCDNFGYLFSSSFELSNHIFAYGASFGNCFPFSTSYCRFYGFQVRGVF